MEPMSLGSNIIKGDEDWAMVRSSSNQVFDRGVWVKSVPSRVCNSEIKSLLDEERVISKVCPSKTRTRVTKIRKLTVIEAGLEEMDSVLRDREPTYFVRGV
ncbi:hypothetical protein COLO4_30711 [Corchorus olitorius]|uniref:Uncharacterized protein n=1 Tax=Corchorus olitorius TaxID=93759 RepID=A0A1R3H747_9ROSI|nr:hypothetical protein COLO4_30711 [Corchorus olitorius]